MSKKLTVTDTAAPESQAALQTQLSSALLDVLRGVNLQAQSTPPLEGAALAAVEHYRDIAEDLFVLPENGINPTTGFSPSQA
jgi:hypothetical protein